MQEASTSILNPRPWAMSLLAVIIAYILALPCDVMEVDAAQYASMSQGMMQSGDWLHLRERDHDYMDKPPLIFWLSSASFSLFGVSNAAYRLPNLLFTLLAIFSAGRLAALLYGKRAGWTAALLSAATQAFFLMGQDVKTDMYLTGSVIFAVWQLAVFTRGGNWLSLILGFVGMSMGMLAKGPLGVIIPLAATGGDLLLRRDWAALFNWRWLVGIPVFLLPLLPFCFAVHDQFGWEGVKFFFWTQSFGRITGESPWVNDTTPFYLVHSFVWAALPWLLIATPLLLVAAAQVIRGGLRLAKSEEGIAVSGFFITFLALSFSRFKLPHYIFVVMPFMAVAVAGQLQRLAPLIESRRWMAGGQSGIFLFAALAAPAAFLWMFPGMPLWLLLLMALLTGAGIACWLRLRDPIAKLLLPSVFFVASVNAGMNGWFYPSVHAYQSPVIATRKVMEINQSGLPYLYFLKGGHAVDFYYGHWVQPINDLGKWIAAPHPHAFYLFTTEQGRREIEAAIPGGIRQVWQFEDQKQGTLALPFLNPNTRAQKVKKTFLLRIVESPSSK